MKVTNVSVKKLENAGNLKGYATVVLDDCLAIHDIKIIEGKEKKFISFPSKKTVINDVEKYFDYVHPTVQTLREEIEKEVFNQFNK
jgi:stage V sporulation protein G